MKWTGYHAVNGRCDLANCVDGVDCGMVLRAGFAAVQDDKFDL